MKKTKHFKERQKQRLVDDYTIQKVRTFGTKTIVNDCINYRWGTIVVVESFSGKLITVHPGEMPKETPKIISLDQVRQIKNSIDKMEEEQKEAAEAEGDDEWKVISLEDYLSGEWLKKIS